MSFIFDWYLIIIITSFNKVIQKTGWDSCRDLRSKSFSFLFLNRYKFVAELFLTMPAVSGTHLYCPQKIQFWRNPGFVCLRAFRIILAFDRARTYFQLTQAEKKNAPWSLPWIRVPRHWYDFGFHIKNSLVPCRGRIHIFDNYGREKGRIFKCWRVLAIHWTGQQKAKCTYKKRVQHLNFNFKILKRFIIFEALIIKSFNPYICVVCFLYWLVQ